MSEPYNLSEEEIAQIADYLDDTTLEEANQFVQSGNGTEETFIRTVLLPRIWRQQQQSIEENTDDTA